jgi:hypothetical protein
MSECSLPMSSTLLNSPRRAHSVQGLYLDGMSSSGLLDALLSDNRSARGRSPLLDALQYDGSGRDRSPGLESMRHERPPVEEPLRVRHACPVQPSSEELPVRVEGRRGISFKVYGKYSMQGVEVKSRIACFMFSAVGGSRQSAFLQEKASSIHKDYQTVRGSFGFRLRYATFFEVDGFFWIALVSYYPILFRKWQLVFRSIGAIDFKVYHVMQEFRGPTRQSIHGVIDIFKSVTMEELTRNLVDYEGSKASPVDLSHALACEISAVRCAGRA